MLLNDLVSEVSQELHYFFSEELWRRKQRKHLQRK
jgi:hypothetical protein